MNINEISKGDRVRLKKNAGPFLKNDILTAGEWNPNTRMLPLAAFHPSLGIVVNHMYMHEPKIEEYLGPVYSVNDILVVIRGAPNHKVGDRVEITYVGKHIEYEYNGIIIGAGYEFMDENFIHLTRYNKSTLPPKPPLESVLSFSEEPINNDGRKICFKCGSKTKRIEGIMNWYDICEKCSA
jgi:hypothetical protein